MLKRAFEATVKIKKGTEGAQQKTLLTRGDVTITTSRTEIEVKNAAADEVRYIPGMESTDFSMTVQAGTDPSDTASYDAYTELLGFYEAGEVFQVEFTSPGGFTRTKDMIVTNWTDNDPVDDINSADVTFRVAAGTAGDTFFGT